MSNEKRSSMDEKIKMLTKWCKRYPKIEMSDQKNEEILHKYNITEEEYEKMKSYYMYIGSQNAKNKLTPEQILKYKEGNIDENLGYSRQIEELSKKYGQSEKIIYHIVKNFETVDKFNKLYKEGKLSQEELTLVGSIISNVLDIDFNPNRDKYNKLYCAIMNKDLKDNIFELYSSEKLNETMLETLTEKEKYIINNRFGLTLEKSERTLKDIATEFGVTTTYIADTEKKALYKLGNPRLREKFSYDLRKIKENEQILNDDEKIIIENLIEKLYLSEVIDKDNLNYKKINTEIICENKKDFSFIKNINQRIKNARNIRDIKIEELDLPIRVNWYFKRLGVNNLGDVSLLTLKELKELEKLNKRSFSDILEQLKEYNITLTDNTTIDEKIKRKYGTIKNFMDLYRKGQIDRIEENSLIKNVLDIDTYTDKYDKLFYDIIKKDPKDNKLQLYSSKKLKSIMLETLNEREKYIIERKYGFGKEDCIQKLPTIGNEIGVSSERVRIIAMSALSKLKHPSKRKEYCYYLDDIENKELFTNEEKNTIDKLINNLYESEILINNNLNKDENIRKFINNEENIEAIEFIKNINEIGKERKRKREEERIKNRDVNDIEIEEINLSCRAYNMLKKARIDTLGEISKRTEDEFRKMKGMGEGSINEIKKVIEKYGLTLKENTSKLQEAKSKKYELQQKKNELEAKIYEAKNVLNKVNETENTQTK